MRSDVVAKHLLCPSCRAHGLDVVSFEGGGPEVRQGVAVCQGCREWYRIEDGLLELLVRRLQDQSKREAFQMRHRAKWGGWTASARAATAAEGDEHKLEQREFYDEDAIPYESHMIKLPFWSAFDRTFLDEIRSHGGGLLVELGCGTGRMSLNVAKEFDVVLGFDISESMVKTAIKKRDSFSPPRSNAHYFIGDAENVPVKTGQADFVLFSGILHHIGAPKDAIRDGARVLKPGGRCLGVENNRSVFRPVFDLLMHVSKLWNEKAHEDHFILSGREIQHWLSEAGFEAQAWTSVFLPPHVFNLFSTDRAERLLRSSDVKFRRLPWLKNQGGLVLFAGRKAK